MCVYVPDNLEMVGSPSQNVLNFDLNKSRICQVRGQSYPLCAQIRSPWLGKFQMKQQSDLNDVQEITALWTYFRENHIDHGPEVVS